MPTPDTARAYYPASDPVHGFEHVLRVYRMAERLAIAEGADIEIVRAAALLHDAQPVERLTACPEPVEGLNVQRSTHHHTSAEIANDVLTAEGWPIDRIAAVMHCIRAHRFRDVSEPPATLEAQVLFDADKLDAIGAVGVARAVAYAAERGNPFFALPSAHFLETGEITAGELHSAYHEFLLKLRRIQDRLYTPTGRAIAAERHRFMCEFFERLVEESS